MTVDGTLHVALNFAAAIGQTFALLARTGTGTLTGCYAPEDIVVTPANYAITVACTTSGIQATVESTTVASEPTAEPVGALVLSAPTPNPFRGRTAFTLAVPTAQPVTVAVYDALGRRVALLFDGLAAPGEAHALTLDGSALPSGLYVVRVTGATGTVSQRVTLQR